MFAMMRRFATGAITSKKAPAKGLAGAQCWHPTLGGGTQTQYQRKEITNHRTSCLDLYQLAAAQ